MIKKTAAVFFVMILGVISSRAQLVAYTGLSYKYVYKIGIMTG